MQHAHCTICTTPLHRVQQSLCTKYNTHSAKTAAHALHHMQQTVAPYPEHTLQHVQHMHCIECSPSASLSTAHQLHLTHKLQHTHCTIGSTLAAPYAARPLHHI
jgi:hypothetical protein